MLSLQYISNATGIVKPVSIELPSLDLIIEKMGSKTIGAE